jgi:calcium permeable stress-gated cation channel
MDQFPSFLSWICKLPKVVVGIIQGVLPPVLLAILFMLLPIVLRIMVRLQGEPRRSDVERKLFSRFWLFQVIHGFLIVTFASGLTTALQNVSKSTSDLPTQLATNLPGASIFFLTFVITSMLSTAGSTNARVVPLVMAKVNQILGGNTPRKAWKTQWGMGSLALATVWPPIALLGCISIVYSVIAPVVVGFGAVGFILWVPSLLQSNCVIESFL